MKLPQAFLFLLTLFTTIHALALPASFDAITDSARDLFKRKGGGGGGGKGGSTGSTGSSSPKGSTGGTTTNSGGSTSGRTTPSFGGSTGPKYYSGGSTTSYPAGQGRTGVGAAPYFFAGAGLGAFGAFGLYGLYSYPYAHPWYYHNNTSNRNETHPVNCVCAQYSDCGCDTNNNGTDYVNDVANNGTISKVMNINGTDTLIVNGTIPNGTTTDLSSAASGALIQNLGYWPIVAGVGYAVWFM